MSKTRARGNKAPEIIWIVMTLLCLGLAVNITCHDGLKKGYVFFAFSLISLLMVFLRKRLRKSSDNS